VSNDDHHCSNSVPAARGAAATAPSVVPLGSGIHLFRWPKGFYQSVFVVGRQGVLAMDPINRDAARAYREAIAGVTSLPVTQLLYSHDHRDHIVGGAEFGLDIEVLAHARAAERIATRADVDILPPTRTVGHGDELRVGALSLEVCYFGPNHSDSNLLVLLPTAQGRVLVWVDGVEPGVAPYRNLPDTDFGGYLHALEQAGRLDFELIVGGHLGPAPRRWVRDYHEYLLWLLDATDKCYHATGGQMPLPGEDGVAMTERVRHEVTARAAAQLRGRFGHWSGFEQWAPQTADRVLSFLITGN
jgi:glyoxylase-like metal-dependent hydrolase (beta-lactamase superfamily II)